MAASRLEPTAAPSSVDLSVAQLRRTWPSLLAATTGLVLFVALALDAGGYFPAAYLTAGVAAYVVLAVVLVARPPEYLVSAHALVAIAALAGLAVWTGISSRWSPAPDVAIREMQRGIVYLGVFGLSVLAAGSGRHARWLAWAALGALVIVVGAGLVSRFYPDVLGDHAVRLRSDEYRLGYPLGYWNAYGALAGIGAVLGVGLTGDPRSPVTLRAVAAGVTVLFACGLYLSFSRGAWLATIAGLTVLVALSPVPGSLLLGFVVAGGASMLAVIRLATLPALTDDPAAASGQQSAGHGFAPELIAVVAGVIALQWIVATGRANDNLMQALRRVVRPLLVGVIAIAFAAAAVLYLARATQVDQRTAGALVSANHWIDRQWDEFMAPTQFTSAGTDRLTSARGTRSDYYSIAVDAVRAHPFRGDGAGGFEVRATRERRNNEIVRNAHSLYHETAGDLGLIGLFLLLMFVGALIFGAVRARVRPAALARPQAAAVSGAVTVWLVHNGVDWDWQMASVTTIGLLLAGLLLPEGRRSRRTA